MISLWIKYAIIAAMSVAGMSVLKHYWPSYPDDNVIEEMVERVIEKRFGVDVDMTLESPEEDEQ